MNICAIHQISVNYVSLKKIINQLKKILMRHNRNSARSCLTVWQDLHATTTALASGRVRCSECYVHLLSVHTRFTALSVIRSQQRKRLENCHTLFGITADTWDLIAVYSHSVFLIRDREADARLVAWNYKHVTTDRTVLRSSYDPWSVQYMNIHNNDSNKYTQR
jgi:hypothetical protein